jgi:hypothetical protein
MTTYAEVLNVEIAKQKVSALAERVTTAKKQLAAMRRRATEEDERAAGSAEHLERLKASAGEAVTEQNSYEKLKVAIKRRTENLAAAREALAILNASIPPAEVELETAERDLHRALVAATEAARGTCESLVTEHLAAAVGEQTAFVAAAKETFARYGSPWAGDTGACDRVLPRARAFRNSSDPSYLWYAKVVEERILTGEVHPRLRPPPAETPEPPADTPATIAQEPAEADVAAVETPPTGECDPSIDPAVGEPETPEKGGGDDGPDPAEVDAQVEAELDDQSVLDSDNTPPS